MKGYNLTFLTPDGTRFIVPCEAKDMVSAIRSFNGFIKRGFELVGCELVNIEP